MGTVQIVITAVAVALLMGFLQAAARKPPQVDQETGNVVLAHGWLLKGIGLVFGLGMCVLLIVLMFTAGFKKPQDPYIAGGLCLFFGVLGGIVLIESFRVRIVLTADAIIGHSPWRETRTIRWADVAEVSYSAVNSWFVIQSVDGQKIRASLYLTGVATLCQAVRRHLRPEQYQGARMGFEMAEPRQ